MAGRKKGSNAMTPLELLIMQVLWRDGPSNVLQVQKGLPESHNLAYTTVQTMLTVLQRKARVRRSLQGRAYVYRPAVSKEKVLGHAVRDLIERMFGGSSEDLLMSLLKSRDIDPERIPALMKKLKAREEGGSDE